MVPINLVPETGTQARMARERVRSLAVLLTVLVIFGGVVLVSTQVVSLMSGGDSRAVGLAQAELESLRIELNKKQRHLESKQAEIERRNTDQAIKLAVAHQLALIPARIPTRVALSSMFINDHTVVLAGVASDRSQVGALVESLKADGKNLVVSVKKLEGLTIEKQALQDFVIERRTSSALDQPIIDREKRHG